MRYLIAQSNYANLVPGFQTPKFEDFEKKVKRQTFPINRETTRFFYTGFKVTFHFSLLASQRRELLLKNFETLSPSDNHILSRFQVPNTGCRLLWTNTG